MAHRIPLTQKQQLFLQYLENYIAEHESSPSLRTTAQDLQISHTAVASMIKTLENKGRVKREGRYGRTVTINRESKENVQVDAANFATVPIIGEVAAGLPLYAQQQWAGTIVVDSRLYRQNSLFALQVQGDSMKNVGILDGDLALCEPRQYADNGEIVVALVDQEEATVKRFFYRGDHIELIPENNHFQPMCYELGRVLIQGKVVGIHRGPEQMARL